MLATVPYQATPRLRKPHARVVHRAVVWIALAPSLDFSSSESGTPAHVLLQKHTTRWSCLDECGSESDWGWSFKDGSNRTTDWRPAFLSYAGRTV
jgi:hypothetical protein